MEQHEGEARFHTGSLILGKCPAALAVRTDKSIDAWPRRPLLTTVKHGASGRCYTKASARPCGPMRQHHEDAP